MALITEEINFNALIKEGVTFTVDSSRVEETDNHDDSDLIERTFEYSNKQCVGIFDEDVYEEGEPFEIIARKMEELVPNGKIRKRVIRPGEGETPNEYSVVKIHYNAYVEHQDEPFDSTYVRNRPFRFTVDGGKVLAGLNFGVKTMKLNEKAQFMVAPEYAYGNCLPGRVQPNATVLFEVELLDIVNSGAVVTYERLPEEKQKLFSEVWKYCMALCEKAKENVTKHNYKKAIYDYNTAYAKLDQELLMNGDEDKKKHQELLMRVLTNLLVCYVRNEQPRKGCTTAEKIYNLTENGERMKIPAKVHFNHGKCLRFLCEYAQAKKVLDKALKMEPRNPEIINELLVLENNKIEHQKQQMAFATALVGKAV